MNVGENYSFISFLKIKNNMGNLQGGGIAKKSSKPGKTIKKERSSRNTEYDLNAHKERIKRSNRLETIREQQNQTECTICYEDVYEVRPTGCCGNKICQRCSMRMTRRCNFCKDNYKSPYPEVSSDDINNMFGSLSV